MLSASKGERKGERVCAPAADALQLVQLVHSSPQGVIEEERGEERETAAALEATDYAARHRRAAGARKAGAARRTVGRNDEKWTKIEFHDVLN